MKLRINQDKMFDGFFSDSRILGIVATLEQYRFCWHLNQVLNFDFRINHNIEIQLQKKTRNYFFPVYQFDSRTGTFSHFLYNNENDGEYLLPEFKHLDYIWLIKDEFMNDEELQMLINSVKTITSVQMVVELVHEKIRNKQHLIF